jgi:hypothetical protein
MCHVSIEVVEGTLERIAVGSPGLPKAPHITRCSILYYSAAYGMRQLASR